jgi:cardiolipin synthase
MIQHAIHAASHRLWIASPYFVPDEAVQDALVLAALRGVDVRILIPDRPDHLLVYLSAFAFLDSMISSGVRVFRYQPAFLHQKVFLVDELVAGVGTVNLDNRSFRLNFEITAIVVGTGFAHDVHQMLVRDFENSRELGTDEARHLPLWLKIASRLAYLFAPVQ